MRHESRCGQWCFPHRRMSFATSGGRYRHVESTPGLEGCKHDCHTAARSRQRVVDRLVLVLAQPVRRRVHLALGLQRVVRGVVVHHHVHRRPRVVPRLEVLADLVAVRTPRSGADTTRASGQRGLALTVSGRVGRIVSERGARTPVTLAMVSPLALTRHEREIAPSFLKACPTGCR